MTAQADTPTSTRRNTKKRQLANLYQEGMIAGVLGAAVNAAWFLAVDTLAGRPLYTPTLLATALFHHGIGLDHPETLSASFTMVVVFAWLHVLVFGIIGGVASHLLAFAERRPNFSFGVVLLLVIFELGYLTIVMVFAQDVLHALAWEKVLAGNLLAATAMAVYLWRRHPHLRIEP